MKIANLLTDNKLVACANIRVDGLNRAPVDTLPLMAAYRDFDAARIDATNRNKTERNAARKAKLGAIIARSEEHTSELQSLMRISYAVFCLKKKKTRKEYSTCDTDNTNRDLESKTQTKNPNN